MCGWVVEIRFFVRKFFCLSPTCPRKIFAERLENIVKPYGRRTIRLDQRLTMLGLKCGGNSGAFVAMLFGIPISNSTILRCHFG